MSSSYLGWGACIVAVICFGTNFLPVKKFETGDGVFFQWVLCCTVFMSGVIVQLSLDDPQFYPLAMLGGFLWCTGNIMVVPIVKMIGLGMGLLVWGLSNLIMGWCSGTFGLFGLDKQTVNQPGYNYAGFVLACLSMVAYVFVKPEAQGRVNAVSDETAKPAYDAEADPNFAGEPHFDMKINSDVAVADSSHGSSWVDKLSPIQKRIVGYTLAVASGIFYGVNFDPPQYLIDNHMGKGNYPDDLMHYVFSHFCGIFFTSTIYFLLYCMYSRNKPTVYPEVVLPAVASGALWSIADIAWFYANDKLQMTIAFPIITTGPGVIGALFGIFLYGEIKGRNNFIIVGIAFAITIAAQILIALSKFLPASK